MTSFKERMIEFGYDAKHVLPHGSYLINLANPDRCVPSYSPPTIDSDHSKPPRDKRKKSYNCFLDDLQRCESLGLKYYNFQCVYLPAPWRLPFRVKSSFSSHP